MSFDLGVWYSDVPLTREEAGEFYHRLNDNRVFVRRHPQFDAFWAELMARFPDSAAPDEPQIGLADGRSAMLETPAELKAVAASGAPPAPYVVPEAFRSTSPYDATAATSTAAMGDDDDEPWAATLAPKGFAVALPISFSRVDQVAVEIFTMVRRHGLVIFNPQETWVWFPPKLKRRKPRPAPPVLRLRIAGKAPALSVGISLGDNVLVHATLSTRQEAHARACDLAVARCLAFYEVDDPGSLAQSLYWQPLEPGDPAYPCHMTPRPGVEVSTLKIRDGEA